MPIIEIPLPLKGCNDGMPVGQSDMGTTGYISNCRPKDVLEKRLRIGQRPGLKKSYSQQIGGDTAPIIKLLSVTIVE